jgi:hypothetical protein
MALAVRISAARQTALHLVDDGSRRRLSGLSDRLARIGVTAQIVTTDGAPAGVVLLDLDAPLPDCATGALRVRPNQLQDATDLAKLLEAGQLVPAQPTGDSPVTAT